MTETRPAAVAGFFYPADPSQLGAEVAGYLANAETAADGPVPKALIAPHAGYAYSGPIAASAYRLLTPAADRIRRVVLLGPAHRVAIRGLAAPSVEAFQTPLGPVSIDRAAIDEIVALPQVAIDDEAHREEHSLEVHLPFLQRVLGEFSLVPLVVGGASGEEVAEVLDKLWGGEETEIVISTDLSHHHDYATAQRMDAATAEAIETLHPEKIEREGACGRIPVAGMLTAAKRRGMQVERLDLRNSGDTAGSRDKVVGYGSWAVTGGGAVAAKGQDEATATDPDVELLSKHGAKMLNAATQTVLHGLDKGKPPKVNVNSFPPELRENRATFVTLTRNGKLRGCIGTVEAHQPLIADVATNAYKAAFKDPRFAPLQEDEKQGLQLSISLLGKPAEMSFKDEADLLSQLRPKQDGLIITDGNKRGVFLPQVWEGLPKPVQFLDRLKVKAGLAADHWSGNFRAWRFAAISIKPGAAPTTDAAADG